MFLRTVWYLIIIFFVVYNLFSLVKNKFVTIIDYQKDVLKEDYLSICLNIDSLEFKCEDIDDRSLIDICNNLRNFFEYIKNNTQFKSPYDIIRKAEVLDIASYFKFKSNSVKAFLKEYYLNQNHLCIFYSLKFKEIIRPEDKQDEFLDEEYNFHTVNVSNPYRIQYMIHFHDLSLPRSVGYHENVKCFNFKKCKNMKAKAAQFKYYFLTKPYDTKCLDYSNAKFSINNTEKIVSKQACLQECLKRQLRSSFFLYSKADRENFSLNHFNDLNQIDSSYVSHCESLCPSQTCFIIYHNFYRIEYIEEDYTNLLISKDYSKCMTKSKMEDFDFYLQFFGFVSLTFGLNFLSFFYKIINRLKSLASDFFVNFKNFFDLFKNLFLICFYILGIITTKIHLNLFMYNNLSDIFVPSTSVEPNNLTIALCREIDKELINLTLDEIDKRSYAYDEISQWPVLYV